MAIPSFKLDQLLVFLVPDLVAVVVVLAGAFDSAFQANLISSRNFFSVCSHFLNVTRPKEISGRSRIRLERRYLVVARSSGTDVRGLVIGSFHALG
jgi:hypothetical protein